MLRAFSRAMLLGAGIATAVIPMTYAQSRPAAPAGTQQVQAGQPQPTGQAAGSEAEERSQGVVGGWLWPILGLAALGGVIAAAAGSGGSNGGVTTSPATTTP